MDSKFTPRDSDGKLIMFTGIENLVEIEEKLHVFIAKQEVKLSHVLNVYGGFDRLLVYPADAYTRQYWVNLGQPMYLQGTEYRITSDYEKKMEFWGKDCSMLMPIVKSIYSDNIKNELKQHFTNAQYMNASRDSIQAIMGRVREVHGGYSVPKSDLSQKRFKHIPKFSSANSVAPILIQMRYEIGLRESWSDVPNGVDYRFSEAEKKSRLVSLLDAWNELKIIHTRLRSNQIQNALTFEQIVDEINVAIQPLKDQELIEQQMAVTIDRNHAGQNTSMAAYDRPPQWTNRTRATAALQKCYNCGRKDGHYSAQCPAADNTRCLANPKGGLSGDAGDDLGGLRQSHALSHACINCGSSNHNISKCMKPICYKCGTIWLSKVLSIYITAYNGR